VLLAWWRRWRLRNADLGRRGEAAAAEFLERLGYRILERTVRWKSGELDLVALDGRTIVFVEVKTRRDDERGTPAQAVDARKRARITRAALAYLKRHRLLQQPARFDVVAVVWPDADGKPEITHYRSAFEARGVGGMFS
jgi:putative endonuclease